MEQNQQDKQHGLLALLRNPHGRSADEQRAARLAAADLIEAKDRELAQLRQVAYCNARDVVKHG